MPLGHAEVQVRPAPSLEVVPDDRVVIYGASDDVVAVEGKVSGCDEYNAEDATFMVIGESSEVRVRVWFTARGVWAIAAAQAAEGMDVLPVSIAGGESEYSVRAVIDGVRLVAHEQDQLS